MLIADIQRAVAKEFRIPVEWMREPSGVGAYRYEHSHPRQAAMALSAELTKHSIKRIGFFFGGRDHTTVLHALRAVAKRRERDPDLDAIMRRVELEAGAQ